MDQPAIAALGKFDALHLGHRALVARAATMGRPVIVTFAGMAEVLGWPPRAPIVAPEDRPRVVAAWAEEFGCAIDRLELPFAEIRDLAPAAFVELLRRDHGIAGVVTGEGFRFGRDRAGDHHALARLCTERGLVCHAEPLARVGAQVVSSSAIREALAAGDVAEAAQLLGRPHRLLGVVEPGDGRGRGIGFPTANLGNIPNLIPETGVYAAHARVDGGEPVAAAVNVGHVPTVAGERPLRVEAHLVDWSGDCYGRPLTLDLLQRLRGERRFDGLEALTAQIARDVERVRGVVPGA